MPYKSDIFDTNDFDDDAQYIFAIMDKRQKAFEKVLWTLGKENGFGNMVSTSARLYKEAVKNSTPGSNFVVGPCESGVVSCGCRDGDLELENQEHCDWCAGCGWLTIHVKEMKVADFRARGIIPE